MIKDVLRLKLHGGLSHEAIARSLSVSKGVVAKYATPAVRGSMHVSVMDPAEAAFSIDTAAARRPRGRQPRRALHSEARLVDARSSFL